MKNARNNQNRKSAYTYSATGIRAFLMPMLAIGSMMIAWSYWYFFGFDFNPANAGTRAETSAEVAATPNPGRDKKVNSRFEMNGVRIGMTADMVRDIHPDAMVTASSSYAGAGGTMVFSTERGRFAAWSRPVPDAARPADGTPATTSDRVWRMRSDEAMSEEDGDEMLSLYGRWYGKPMESACSKPKSNDSITQCRYRWWGGEGIMLDVISRNKKSGDGSKYVVLSTIATDFAVQARMGRDGGKKAEAGAAPANAGAS